MTDHSAALTQLDLRLERVLGAYAETAVRPVDVVAIADHAVLLDRRRRGRRSWTWLAAAAAVALLALLAIAALGGGGRSLLSWLDPGPTPSGARPTPIGVVPALQGRWMGSPRAIGALDPSAGTYIAIQDGLLCVSGRDYSQACTLLSSAASQTGSGELRLTTRAGAIGCAPETAGTYRWTLSPGGGRLVLEAIADECAVRSDGLAGSWFRAACTNPADDCLGVLEAGTYPSQFVHVTGPTGTYPAADYGALRYTVPDGWANSGDWVQLLALTRAADYAREGEQGPPIGAYNELDVFSHPVAAAQGTGCDGTVASDLDAPTAAAFATWLAAQPAFAVTDRGALTVDGRAAVSLDIRLAPSWTSACPGESSPSADYLLLRDDPGRGFTPRLRGAEVHRLILVDLGAGELLAIVIDSSDPARFDDLVAASMPIVSSLVIR